MDLRQIAGGAVSGLGMRPLWRASPALSGVLQTGDESQGYGRGQLRAAGRARLSAELQTRRFLDEAFERRAREQRLGDRAWHALLVPPHPWASGNGGNVRLLGDPSACAAVAGEILPGLDSRP